MKRNLWTITTRHASLPSLTGTFEAEVVTNNDNTRFAKCGPFGCSRDYHVVNDVDAIAALLREHATTLVSWKEAAC